MRLPRNKEHPARLLQRFGVLESPAVIAVGLLALLQYVFLGKLWEGFPIRWNGDVIHTNVVDIGVALSLVGAIAILIISICRWLRMDSAARRLDKPANDPSFAGIHTALIEIVDRSTLSKTPHLLYHLKDALALEVRESHSSGGAIVVGLNQRAKQKLDPLVFRAQLGHETSHLEVASTRLEIAARRIVTLHFRIFGYLLTVFLLVLGFIDIRGIGSTPRLMGFVPIFDLTIYVGLSAQIAAIMLSSVVILVYSYYFIVRREYIHDVRGSQLAGTDILATHVFLYRPSLSILARIFCNIKEFFTLHPHPASRRRVVLERDFVLMSSIAYPLIVAGIQPLALLLTAGWRSFFGVEEHWWNLGLTITTGFILFMALSADITRLGLRTVLGLKRPWLSVSVYAVVAGMATQVPRLVLEVIYGLRKELPIDLIFLRIGNGFISGGLNIILMIATVLVVLTYLASVRISATGEHQAGHWAPLDRIATAILVVGAFTIMSLKSVEFILDVLIILGIIVLIHAFFFSFMSRCVACGNRRLEALLLKTKCQCGHDQLAFLRHWAKQPYEYHLEKNLDQSSLSI